MNKAAGAVAALFTSLTLLAGCASTEQNAGLCPSVRVLAAAERVIEFDGAETAENVAYTGEILSAQGSCRYFEDKPINASIEMDIAFGRGPKGLEQTHDFEYFVAVTRTDLVIVEKQVFPVEAKFRKGDVVRIRENVSKIVIPRASERVSGSNFEIIVGLQLTPRQARFNRSGKSLKFPNL
ncbi:MAG: hypothetical protein AAGC95_01190 [Pseudomonadota bacterium]